MVYYAAPCRKDPGDGHGKESSNWPAAVVEFILAGAIPTRLQIGTASLLVSFFHREIVDELQNWCVEHEIARLGRPDLGA